MKKVNKNEKNPSLKGVWGMLKLSTFNSRLVSFVEPQLLTLFSILLTITMLGCIKDNDIPDEPINPDEPVEVIMQDITMSGIIKDTNGNPLSGVRITTGSLNTTTTGNGAFTFAKAGTVNDRIVVVFEKSGYFTLTRSADCKDIENNDFYLEAMMSPKGNSAISQQVTFDAATAKTVQVGELKIDFPASSFVRADGSAYSGNVRADVLLLDPASANFSFMMPGGDLTCSISKTTEEILLPYGMADVVFTDNDGNPLKLKEKAGVEISFPISAIMSADAPATIPLWSFNEPRGVWLQNGTLIRQGNVYKGVVSHFSPVSGGKTEKMITVRVTVAACKERKGGIDVRINDYKMPDMPPGDELAPLWTTHFLRTNSAGVCSARMPASSGFNVDAYYKSRHQSQWVPPAPGKFGATHEIIFNFDDDCSEEEIPESVAVKFIYPGDDDDEFYYCEMYDNYGKRHRTDQRYWNWEEGSSIFIQDYINNKCYEYFGADWQTDAPLNAPVDDYLAGIRIVSNDDKTFEANGYKRKLPDVMILGKTCKVWELSDGTVHYVWRRIGLRTIWKGKLQREALVVTENVPASAFTKTLDISWLK